MQTEFGVHLVFDLLAVLAATGTTVLVYRWRLAQSARIVENAGIGYAASLVAGAAIGGFGLGTLNLWLCGVPMIGRSVIGALVGAIAAVEAFKFSRGVRQSTGLIFVPAFVTSVLVGRWGCYLAGLEDFTHGIETQLPWGHDFGDGVLRHPVQLYESFSMLAFLALALICLARRTPFFMRHGFYLMTGWYAVQRFAWETLKPYAQLAANLNVFQLTALVLLGYAVVMIVRNETDARTGQRA